MNLPTTPRQWRNLLTVVAFTCGVGGFLAAMAIYNVPVSKVIAERHEMLGVIVTAFATLGSLVSIILLYQTLAATRQAQLMEYRPIMTIDEDVTVSHFILPNPLCTTIEVSAKVRNYGRTPAEDVQVLFSLYEGDRAYTDFENRRSIARSNRPTPLISPGSEHQAIGDFTLEGRRLHNFTIAVQIIYSDHREEDYTSYPFTWSVTVANNTPPNVKRRISSLTEDRMMRRHELHKRKTEGFVRISHNS